MCDASRAEGSSTTSSNAHPNRSMSFQGINTPTDPMAKMDGDSADDGFLFVHRRECAYGTCPTCSSYVFDQCPRHRQTIGQMRAKEVQSGKSERTGVKVRATDTAVAVRAEHQLPGYVPVSSE